ncbi:hypothetical protein AKJ56_01140 [candidate division MSBL1 archaeon SCGC-AAA382N08]|uniref:Uncharacterized protein n=1 Tax=candidate division MSBL1 archaeon SCGC-AAA382N08 TaxID=1698285 RepID=A0A133VPY6_9EURY|nr:hypothetical protein AKJ56_01140 [candidate division MSBL1 archaeon SCGC-AAA382N08]
MGYSEGEDKYADRFVAGICRPLVEEGEFDSMEECKKAAEDDASTQASNWASEAPAAMAAYLQA